MPRRYITGSAMAGAIGLTYPHPLRSIRLAGKLSDSGGGMKRAIGLPTGLAELTIDVLYPFALYRHLFLSAMLLFPDALSKELYMYCCHRGQT